MAKAAQKSRGKFADEKYLGPEPVLTNEATVIDLCHAYNWFNYFYSDEDAKDFTLAYLKAIKYDKKKMKLVAQMRADKLHNIGWNCRMMMNGSDLPDNILMAVKTRLNELIAEEVEVVEAVEDDTKIVPVISIQDRINNKTSDLIADLEDQVDVFIKEGRNKFDPVAWMRTHEIKPQIAQKIADHYKPLYSELFDAMQGQDEQLKEGYRHLKKIQLKSYMEFIRSIVASAEARTVVAVVSRKPRKKKEKPVAIIVAKMKYKVEDTDLKIKSINPAELVGSNQLWVFNAKLRNLTVYNAMGPAGLTVKGTTIVGYDEKTSMTKKLRKPEVTLKTVIEAGKVTLRKSMDNIKGKAKPANGRINMEVVLLRAIK
jgi:hypothetical protein